MGHRFSRAFSVVLAGVFLFGMVPAGPIGANPTPAPTPLKIAIITDSSIVGVVGHLNSGCSIPASGIYATKSLAMVSPFSTNPALTQMGRNNVFRTVTTDKRQGPTAADVVCSQLRLRTAYVVDDSTPYGEILSYGFRSRFKAVGGTVVGTAKTSDRDTDFTALVKIIKAKHPAVVYYAGIYNAGSLLASQLKAARVSAVFAGADGIYDPAFVSLTGAKRAAGAVATNIGIPVDQMTGGPAFRAHYKATYGHAEVSNGDAYAYDATQAILKAIIAVASAGTPSDWRPSVRAKVASSAFYGVTGPVGFNSSGDTKYPAVCVYRVKNGAWRECALVGTPVISAAPKSGVAFTVSGTLRPHHTVGSYGATLRFWRRESGKWILRKTVAARVIDDGSFSKYAARVQLHLRGSWRVSAEHSDGPHPAMISGLRNFAVK